MSNESHECKYCGASSEITQDAKGWKFTQSIVSPSTGHCHVFFIEVFYCLNPDCGEISSKITAFRSNSPLPADWEQYQPKDYVLDLSKEPQVLELCHYLPHPDDKFIVQQAELSTIKTWDLLPGSIEKKFPDYIPKAILEDYREACAIKDLSPKAAATLTRRCLQGMIRDFFGIEKKRNLKEEIDAIKGRKYVSDEVWGAIQGVREIGNIGAHMEKDINLIVDIDSDEAENLIWLIEYLFEEWYVARDQQIRTWKKLAQWEGEKNL